MTHCRPHIRPGPLVATVLYSINMAVSSPSFQASSPVTVRREPLPFPCVLRSRCFRCLQPHEAIAEDWINRLLLALSGLVGKSLPILSRYKNPNPIAPKHRATRLNADHLIYDGCESTPPPSLPHDHAAERRSPEPTNIETRRDRPLRRSFSFGHARRWQHTGIAGELACVGIGYVNWVPVRPS